LKYKLVAYVAFCLGCVSAISADESGARNWTTADSVPWVSNEGFNAIRWKDLLGGDGKGQIPQKDLRFGLLQIAPRAVYPGHRHAAPEVYYILSGKAQWTVGQETFIAESGTTIFIPANTVHRMTNLGELPVTAVWAWWAPGGDQSVFDPDAYEFTEAIPEQSGF